MKEIYVLMNDYEGKMRQNPEITGFAVSSEEEAIKYAAYYGADAVYYKMPVFETLAKGFAWIKRREEEREIAQEKMSKAVQKFYAKERAAQSIINQKKIRDFLQESKSATEEHYRIIEEHKKK